MNRRHFFSLIILAYACLSASSSTFEADSASDRPNILLILIDDMGSQQVCLASLALGLVFCPDNAGK